MNLEKASNCHGFIIICILVYFLALFFLRGYPVMLGLVAVATWIVNIILGYKLADALDKDKFLWLALGIFGPVLIWIPHLLLINSANKTFKKNGMKVGFFGGARKVG